MTTPDTLASLIASLPHGCEKSDAINHVVFSVSREYCIRCRFEAAHDALVEKWEQKGNEMTKSAMSAIYLAAANERLSCAAELRGRGASET